MNEPRRLVVFTLDEQRYALDLSAVKRVVHVVEIAPLPGAPETVLGVINVHGTILPVFDLRKRFQLPDRETRLTDQLILAGTSRRPVALLVDAVAGLLDCPEDSIVAPEKILPKIEYVDGVAGLESGLLFIHDLDRFLSLGEEETLDQAMWTHV